MEFPASSTPELLAGAGAETEGSVAGVPRATREFLLVPSLRLADRTGTSQSAGPEVTIVAVVLIGIAPV